MALQRMHGWQHHWRGMGSTNWMLTRIWCDYDPSQFDEPPLWMVDPSVKEGIPLAQMVMNCHSEVMHCEVENANLHQWLTEESYKAYEVYYGAWVVDIDVAFFSLLHIHELHGLQRNL